MREKMLYIQTNDCRYPIIFDLNVLYELQKKFDSFNKWSDMFSDLGWECVIDTVEIFVNEGIDYENEITGDNRAFITSRQAGRIVSELGIDKIIEIIKDSVIKYNNSKNV